MPNGLLRRRSAATALCAVTSGCVLAASAMSAATAPNTSIDGHPPTFSISRSPSLSFSGTQRDARFECSLDNGGFASCSSPYQTTDLALGGHVFAVRAIDSAGRADPTPATYRWRIVTDLNPPVIEVPQLPPNGHVRMRLFRNLRGTAKASAGVSTVQVALRVWGIRRQETLLGPTYCLFANLHNGKIVVSPCLQPRYVTPNGKRHWALHVTRKALRRLPPITYELQVRAINAAGEGVIFKKKIEIVD
ncbi:MAG TPA: hypothetical protein VF066_11475 [Thermoleophilaceae bacterium]